MSCNPVEDEIQLLNYTLAHMKKDNPNYSYLQKRLQKALQLVYGEDKLFSED